MTNSEKTLSNSDNTKNNDNVDGASADTTTAKLRWQCRRGMLELDVIFGDFLDKGYPLLTKQQRLAFDALLERPDPELYAWIMGYEAVIPEYRDIVDQVIKTRPGV